jgi:probable rRNA maturation factor
MSGFERRCRRYFLEGSYSVFQGFRFFDLMLTSKRMSKKRLVREKSRVSPKKTASRSKTTTKAVAKTASKKSPVRNRVTAYEREAGKTLETILSYASATKALRKKAGFSGPSKEPLFGLDVSFVTRARMKTLNKQYRGKDAPTDVLSFPAPEVFVRQGHLGDVVICVPVMESQAKEVGHAVRQELRVLLVHGLLHLIGYDHERSSRESVEMSKWEAKLLGDTGLIQRVSSED